MRRPYFRILKGLRFGPWPLSVGRAYDLGRLRIIIATPAEYQELNSRRWFDKTSMEDGR